MKQLNVAPFPILIRTFGFWMKRTEGTSLSHSSKNVWNKCLSAYAQLPFENQRGVRQPQSLSATFPLGHFVVPNCILHRIALKRETLKCYCQWRASNARRFVCLAMFELGKNYHLIVFVSCCWFLCSHRHRLVRHLNTRMPRTSISNDFLKI